MDDRTDNKKPIMQRIEQRIEALEALCGNHIMSRLHSLEFKLNLNFLLTLLILGTVLAVAVTIIVDKLQGA
tara:strand:- start:137 stop:349 length:213 start_codon:yes stop_codon:yes gene_type:complete